MQVNVVGDRLRAVRRLGNRQLHKALFGCLVGREGQIAYPIVGMALVQRVPGVRARVPDVESVATHQVFCKERSWLLAASRNGIGEGFRLNQGVEEGERPSIGEQGEAATAQAGERSLGIEHLWIWR